MDKFKEGKLNSEWFKKLINIVHGKIIIFSHTCKIATTTIIDHCICLYCNNADTLPFLFKFI